MYKKKICISFKSALHLRNKTQNFLMQCKVGSGNRHLSTGVLLGNMEGEAHLLGSL